MEQVGTGLTTLDQIGLIDPKHEALIGAAGFHQRSVELHGIDQQQVAGPQTVDLSLHPVLHLTAQKEIDLIKFMVMDLHGPRLGIHIMENLKFRPLHILPRIKALYSVPHSHPSKLILQQDLQCVKQLIQ